MTEPRIHPLSDAEADGTQALLIANAEHVGAPDPLCTKIYVRAEAGRNWLRHWNELLNGGSLPVPLKEMCRVLISMRRSPRRAARSGVGVGRRRGRPPRNESHGKN